MDVPGMTTGGRVRLISCAFQDGTGADVWSVALTVSANVITVSRGTRHRILKFMDNSFCLSCDSIAQVPLK